MTSIPLLKVVIAGDGNVGKTSLVRQYCEGKFTASRVMTIGVDFQTKLVELPSGTVKLSIWDMAGQERFQAVRSSFYRGSLAVALTYDLTVPSTLDSLKTWFEEIARVVPGIPAVVVANKSDLARTPEDPSGREFARQLGAGYLRTSACTGEGVQVLFEMLGTLALMSVNPTF